MEKLPHSGAPGKIPENSQSGEKFRLTPVEKLKNWLTPVFQGIFPENSQFTTAKKTPKINIFAKVANFEAIFRGEGVEIEKI